MGLGDTLNAINSAHKERVAERNERDVADALSRLRAMEFARNGKRWVGKDLIIASQVRTWIGECDDSYEPAVRFIASTPNKSYCMIDLADNGEMEFFELSEVKFAEMTLDSSLLAVA